MTITHHPDVATLMSCAAGSQPEVFAAVVASHLAVCPKCRAEVGKMQEIGVALFDRLEPATMAADAPVVAARASEANEEVRERGESLADHGDVPAHLAPILGASLDRIGWKALAPGIWYFPVKLSDGAKGDLRLIRVAPGKALPEHGHTGEELTLVLRGSYSDQLGTFREGDVADLDPDVEHTPVADPETGCICLLATESKARFKGPIARLLQPLIGL